MKTFLGFTTGVFTGVIGLSVLLAWMADDDPEWFKGIYKLN